MGNQRKSSLPERKMLSTTTTSNKIMVSALILLPSLATASILPIKFNFGSSGNSFPSLKSVQQCEGHENDALVLLEGTTPDSICMPGTTEINMHKLIPFPMTVPCLNGVGSCEYELCPMIEDMADT